MHTTVSDGCNRNSTGNAQGNPARTFMPVRPVDESEMPDVILEWIKAKAPEHDGRLYFRVSDVCDRFPSAKMFYHVVAALHRHGMAEVERWRLERLDGRKWNQLELVYVVKPLDLKRPIEFECYALETAPARPFSKEERLEIWQRFGGVCFYCDKPVSQEDMAVDHGLPRSRGGSNDPSNLICACHPCNSAKRTQTVEEFLQSIGRDVS